MKNYILLAVTRIALSYVILMKFCQILIVIHCYLKMLPLGEGSKSFVSNFAENVFLIVHNDWFTFFVAVIYNWLIYKAQYCQLLDTMQVNTTFTICKLFD